MRAALYLRVSTGEQTVENQRRDLLEAAAFKRWEIVGEYADEGISGAKGRDMRPAFDRLCQDVTRGKIEMVAAWSIDRLGRSVADLVAFLGELHGAGCNLYLHRQAVDTTTSPAGRAMFQMMGVFAEFERALIVERTLAGLQRARAAGKVLGRRRVPADVAAAVRAALGAGMTVRSAAKAAGCGIGTAHRIGKAIEPPE